MKHISRISSTLKVCSMVCLAALPLTEAGYWITGGYPFLQNIGFAADPLPQFGSHQLAILLIGMAVLLVAGIMEQAADLYEEQQGTV